MQTPNAHLNGQGCTVCYQEAKANQVTTADFIRRSIEVHGQHYDYSKSVYSKTLDKVEIICPVHGSFWQQAGQHMLGQTCAKCYHDGMRKTHDVFVTEAQTVHGNVYVYPSEYTGFFDYLEIECSEHGTFIQRADIHLRGSGCPKCVSKMTSKVSAAWLESLNLPNLILEYHIPTTRYHADAFCPSTNTVYEFYGDFWHGNLNRYHPDKLNPINNLTMRELNNRTMQREEVIKSLGYNLITLWESDWNTIKEIQDVTVRAIY